MLAPSAHCWSAAALADELHVRLLAWVVDHLNRFLGAAAGAAAAAPVAEQARPEMSLKCRRHVGRARAQTVARAARAHTGHQNARNIYCTSFPFPEQGAEPELPQAVQAAERSPAQMLRDRALIHT